MTPTEKVERAIQEKGAVAEQTLRDMVRRARFYAAIEPIVALTAIGGLIVLALSLGSAPHG